MTSMALRFSTFAFKFKFTTEMNWSWYLFFGMPKYCFFFRPHTLSQSGFLTVSLSSGHISESTGGDMFWRRKASCERRRHELPGGGGGGV